MRTLQKVLHIQNFYLYNVIFWVILCVFDIFRTYSFINFFDLSFNSENLILWPVSKYIIYWILSYWIFDIYLKTRQKSLPSFIVIHIITGLGFAILHRLISDIAGILLQRLFFVEISGSLSDILDNWDSLIMEIPANMIIYGMVIIILLGLDYYHKFVDEHIRLLELESKLGSVQLKSLKMQLHPHFLFNAFNTIIMMMRQSKNEVAIKMTSGLSDMLRHSLAKEPHQFVQLKEEIELIKKYLLIESERYKDRLKIIWEIDESLLTQIVPSMILQPIVENAFKHGIEKNLEPSTLKISVTSDDINLYLEVFNTGSFLPINWNIQKNKGIGLANTINRLMKLYQDGFKIIISEKNRGVAVQVKIPLKNVSQ